MDKEKYFSDKQITGKFQKVIAAETGKALAFFCGAEKEFEQAIEQSDKTFQQCLDAITKDFKPVGGISDLETYNKAVRFYFPTAVVHFDMRIDLCGGDVHPSSDKPENANKSSLSISLDELLDF